MDPAPKRQHYGVTLLILVCAALAYALAQTMVAPALPEIQRQYDASTTTVTFVLTAFLLSASVATPILGRLGDMYGKERVLVIVLLVFAAGSAVAAMASSIWVLIAGRAIQGAAGAVFPLAFGIIRDEFPPERVATGIGLISATFGIGGGAGIVLSGLIVEHLSISWIFWLSVGTTCAATVATWLYIPESPVKAPAKIDWAGGGLLTLTLVSLLVGVSEGNAWGWTSPGVLGLFALGLLLLSVWIRHQSRIEYPLVDMVMMRQRAVWTTNLTAFMVGFAMFSSFVLIPQLVQLPVSTGFGFGASVAQAGLYLLPSAAVMLICGPIAGVLGSRYGSRLPLRLGTVLIALSFGLLVVAHTEPWQIYLSSFIVGVGISFAFASMANLIVEAVDQTKVGVATGINTITRNIGGALGSQVVASVLVAHVALSGLPQESGFTLAFGISTVAALLAFAAALAVPTRRRPSSSPAYASAEASTA